MRNALIVDQFMTYAPHTVNSGMQLKTARQLLKKYGVRHLPVQFGGHLVGIVSGHDLNLAKSFDKEGTLMVDDIMTPDPYSVPPGTPLGEVVEKMATNRYGCAIVLGVDGKVKGIFTAIDGLRAISENLNIKKRKSRNAQEELV